MATPQDIENWFSYHYAKGDQAERYEHFRGMFKSIAMDLAKHTNPCADQTAAFRKLREASMAVNQTIACNESYNEQPPEAEVSGSHP